MIYLISYKHKRKVDSLTHLRYRFFDELTRFFTRGKYTHSEIAIKQPNGSYDCYSSSVRDKGVRKKNMFLKPERWDFIELPNVTEAQVEYYFNLTDYQKYDFLGAIGLALPFRDNSKKQFCSEWCYNAINSKMVKGMFCDSKNGWRFSPSQLYAIYNKNY